MVHFVGAGPGASDLITIRGKELLEKADVIIYAGSLVNPELLNYKNDTCVVFNSAYMNLDEVIEECKKAQEEGKEVVRLHTGDPSIYGAIREQMDRLKELGISYDVCPGVSSFFGAAASLQVEYTLPEVSQTVIITRAAGRTPVPEKENLRSIASHGATLVLFLSMGQVEAVQEELLASGGYQETTPCAIVYKATWQDEKILRGTLQDLAKMAKDNQIQKTALIVVGNVLGDDYALSKLYDASFETEFRKATVEKKIHVLSFTKSGEAVNDRLVAALEADGKHAVSHVFSKEEQQDARFFSDTKRLLQDIFHESELIVFVGATGIAVRTIAPFLKSKTTDPAVVSVDDTGAFVVSLVSGHIGGANDWTNKISSLIGATPVISTATDLHDKFAVDVFAKKNGLAYDNISDLKKVSADILSGKEEVLSTDLPWKGKSKNGIKIVNYDTSVTDCALYPRNIYLGMGCKKGKSFDELFDFVQETLHEYHIPLQRIAKLVSVDVKSEEPGLLALANKLQVPFETFSSEDLNRVPGCFHESDFVKDQIHTGNVCERSVICAFSTEQKFGGLCLPKHSKDGMTLALGMFYQELEF